MKGLSIESQVDVTPWLADPGFPSLRPSLAAPLKCSPMMEGRGCFAGPGWLCQQCVASQGTGYQDKVHTGEEERAYRASGAENDLSDS